MDDIKKYTKPEGLFYLHFWGSINNEGLSDKEISKSRDFWFPDPETRDKYKKRIKDIADKHDRIVMFSEYNGVQSHCRAVVFVIYEYKGIEYPFVYNGFRYGFPLNSAEYIFLEGNNSCDCCISEFIGFEEFECGNIIKIKELNVMHLYPNDIEKYTIDFMIKNCKISTKSIDDGIKDGIIKQEKEIVFTK